MHCKLLYKHNEFTKVILALHYYVEIAQMQGKPIICMCVYIFSLFLYKLTDNSQLILFIVICIG